MRHHDSSSRWEFEEGPPCRSVHVLLVSRKDGHTFTIERPCRRRKACRDCRQYMGRREFRRLERVAVGSTLWVHHERTAETSAAVRQRRLRKRAEFLRIRTDAGVTHFLDRSIGEDAALPQHFVLLLAEALLLNDAQHVSWSKGWRPTKSQPWTYLAAQAADLDLLHDAVRLAESRSGDRLGAIFDRRLGIETARVPEWLALVRECVKELREAAQNDVAKNPLEGEGSIGETATSADGAG